MNGLSKIWRRNLQPVLEALSQGVIITLETGHIVFAKHPFLEIASGIVGDGRDRLRHRAAAFGSDEGRNTQTCGTMACC